MATVPAASVRLDVHGGTSVPGPSVLQLRFEGVQLSTHVGSFAFGRGEDARARGARSEILQRCV